MLHYLLRRFLYSILLLWGVATLVFLLFNVLPPSPARLTLGRRSDAASVAAARKALRLDKPLLTRYGLYLNDLSPIGVTSSRRTAVAPAGLHLTRVDDSSYLSLKAPHLGRSYSTKRSVSAVLGEALPGTIRLALTAMLLAVVTGLGLGILSALKKKTLWDTGAIAVAVAGISAPAFFAGLVIAYAAGYVVCSQGMPVSVHPHNLILPALALSIRPMAIIIWQTRDAMLLVLRQDYIRAAYARGLGKTRLVLRHALPNALGPVVQGTSTWLAELLAGTFFVEFIFGRKGIGTITVDALNKFDLPVIIGVILITALIFIIVKLLTDVLAGLLDPRVRS
jgi:peptide/nickel transport system permease protein